MTQSILTRAGALVYGLWGLLHIGAAYQIYDLGTTMTASMEQGRVFQGAFNLLLLALFSIVIALVYNWRNSRSGYWLNLIVIGATDLGFVALVLAPGHMAWWPGLVGPLLWAVAAILSTLAGGYRSDRSRIMVS